MDGVLNSKCQREQGWAYLKLYHPMFLIEFDSRRYSSSQEYAPFAGGILKPALLVQALSMLL